MCCGAPLSVQLQLVTGAVTLIYSVHYPAAFGLETDNAEIKLLHPGVGYETSSAIKTARDRIFASYSS